MMRILAILAMMLAVVLGSCGHENSCDVSTESHGTIAAEEVSEFAADSTSESSEGATIVASVGGQLLRLAYAKYSDRGGTESELNQLPKSLFTINLVRLYRDMNTAVE